MTIPLIFSSHFSHLPKYPPKPPLKLHNAQIAPGTITILAHLTLVLLHTRCLSLLLECMSKIWAEFTIKKESYYFVIVGDLNALASLQCVAFNNSCITAFCVCDIIVCKRETDTPLCDKVSLKKIECLYFTSPFCMLQHTGEYNSLYLYLHPYKM